MKWWTAYWQRWRSRVNRTTPSPWLIGWLSGIALLSLPLLQFPAFTAVVALSVCVLTAVTAYDFWYLRKLGTLTIERYLPTLLQMGVESEITLVISPAMRHASRKQERLWRKTLLALRADFGVPLSHFSVEEGEKRGIFEPLLQLSLNRSVKPKRRGPGVWNGGDVVWSSPFGLWTRMQRFDDETAFRVLPDVSTWRKPVQAVQRALSTEGHHVRRMKSGQTEFSHISEYSADDDPRHLNWSATARRGRLMKNVYQPERGQQLILAVDASRYMGVSLPDGQLRLDYAVTCAAALAHTAISSGDDVGLIAFTDQIRLQVAPGRRKEHFTTLVNGLSAIAPESVQGGYHALFQSLSGRFHRRGLLVILTELEGVMTDTTFLTALKKTSLRHPTVLVTISDIQATERFRTLPAKVSDLTDIASAAWVLRDRAGAIQTLRRQGVSVVESAPGDIVVDVVRDYLRRRRRFVL